MNDQRFSLTTEGQYGTVVYSMQPGEQLSRFDVGMLMNNNISGVLGYASESSADGSRLVFNIRKGTRLSLLRNKPMNVQYAFSVLLGITDVMLGSEQYMLKENRFVFDEDCIFIDPNTCAANLVYVPSIGYNGISFAQFVKSFITNGVFGGEETGSIMELLNFVNAYPNAAPDDLKQILEKIKANFTPSAPSVQRESAPQPAVITMPQQSAAHVKLGQAAQAVPNAPKAESGSEKVGLFAKMFGSHKSKNESPSSAPVAGEKPSAKPQPMQAGIMAGMNIPGMSSTSPAAKPVEENKKFFKKENRPAPEPAPVRPQNEPPIVEPEIMPTEQSPETVQLKRKTLTQNSEKHAYLIAKNGERVMITGSGFTVGKENTSGVVNDYMIKNPSVSRNHAMFEIKGGKCYVVDMTSLNGTFVNGKQISSNVEFELNSGDTIIFAEVEFKFVIE